MPEQEIEKIPTRTERYSAVIEEILGIPKSPVIDFTRYATERMPLDLIGKDTTWKGGSRTE